MTAEQNATLVRRGYEAFNSGDLATLAELVREDVVFYQPGSSEVAGEHRGRDEVFGYFGRLAQHSEGTFRAEIEELYASDRHAVVVHHATGRRNGSALDTRTVLVFRLEDGRVARFDAVQEDQQAFDAFFAG